jgi:cobalt-zinc-cadmium resistance protein CzcA
MEPVLLLHGTEVERPLAIVLIGGLITTIFTLLVLPTFYLHVHGWLSRGEVAAEPS